MKFFEKILFLGIAFIVSYASSKSLNKFFGTSNFIEKHFSIDEKRIKESLGIKD